MRPVPEGDRHERADTVLWQVLVGGSEHGAHSQGVIVSILPFQEERDGETRGIRARPLVAQCLCGGRL